MLIYNKPFEIKDRDDNVLYTIKELTLDAEYELENLSYKIQEKREILLGGDRFVTLTEEETDITNKYFNAINKKAKILQINKPKEFKLVAVEKEIKQLLKALEITDLAREKAGKRIITFTDILHNMSKSFLKESAEWLMQNIEGFEQMGYYECAVELELVSSAFERYKAELKKK